MTGVFEFIEDYLIRDLKSMRSIESSDGLGKCGYQMMMSLCSACEMLGSLEKNEFESSGGNLRFKFFLENHLPAYVSSWEILYYFIRHRVAHDFITPPGIIIQLKNDKTRHLGLMDEWFVVDVYVFMDNFISAYRQIKERYSKDSDYKKLLDDGYKLLIQFIENRSKELQVKISQSQFKHLNLPDEENFPIDQAVPSGAAFEPDHSNFTRIPDDMLEKINQRILGGVASSGASGSTIKDKDITPLK